MFVKLVRLLKYLIFAGPVKYHDKDGKDPDVLHIYGKVLVKVARDITKDSFV